MISRCDGHATLSPSTRSAPCTCWGSSGRRQKCTRPACFYREPPNQPGLQGEEVCSPSHLSFVNTHPEAPPPSRPCWVRVRGEVGARPWGWGLGAVGVGLGLGLGCTGPQPHTGGLGSPGRKHGVRPCDSQGQERRCGK